MRVLPGLLCSESWRVTAGNGRAGRICVSSASTPSRLASLAVGRGTVESSLKTERSGGGVNGPTPGNGVNRLRGRCSEDGIRYPPIPSGSKYCIENFLYKMRVHCRGKCSQQYPCLLGRRYRIFTGSAASRSDLCPPSRTAALRRGSKDVLCVKCTNRILHITHLLKRRYSTRTSRIPGLPTCSSLNILRTITAQCWLD